MPLIFGTLGTVTRLQELVVDKSKEFSKPRYAYSWRYTREIQGLCNQGLCYRYSSHVFIIKNSRIFFPFLDSVLCSSFDFCLGLRSVRRVMFLELRKKRSTRSDTLRTKLIYCLNCNATFL